MEPVYCEASEVLVCCTVLCSTSLCSVMWHSGQRRSFSVIVPNINTHTHTHTHTLRGAGGADGALRCGTRGFSGQPHGCTTSSHVWIPSLSESGPVALLSWTRIHTLTSASFPTSRSVRRALLFLPHFVTPTYSSPLWTKFHSSLGCSIRGAALTLPALKEVVSWGFEF